MSAQQIDPLCISLDSGFRAGSWSSYDSRRYDTMLTKIRASEELKENSENQKVESQNNINAKLVSKISRFSNNYLILHDFDSNQRPPRNMFINLHGFGIKICIIK